MKEDWIYGIHVLQSFLEQSPERILEIYLVENRQDKRIEEIKAAAKTLGIAIKIVNKKQFALFKDETIAHQGVAARVRLKNNLDEHELMTLITSLNTQALLLVLDNIQDPHNLGACLRTADAVGVHAVIIPKHRSAKVNATVRKVASGAAESVPIVEVTNLVRCLDVLKKQGVWILGATAEPTASVFETDLKGPVALVFGAEDTGMRRLTAETCDALLRIPMVGVVKSLNVSVATSVCLYEAFRQRNRENT